MHFPPSLHILFQASSLFQDIPNTIAVCGGLTDCGGAVVVGDVAEESAGKLDGPADVATSSLSSATRSSFLPPLAPFAIWLHSCRSFKDWNLKFDLLKL